jgi:hypothetical protein
MTCRGQACNHRPTRPPEEYMTRSLLPPRAWQEALASSNETAAALTTKHCDMVASQKKVLLYCGAPAQGARHKRRELSTLHHSGCSCWGAVAPNPHCSDCQFVAVSMNHTACNA